MQLPLIERREQRQPLRREDSSVIRRQSNPVVTGPMLEFGRFHVLLRRRKLLADGVPIELGTRAFDLLLVLLEADGSLVTKDELIRQVWPGIVVAEENLKVQISALRKALGEDRDFIRTEFGRGYRFTAAVRSITSPNACRRPTSQRRRSDRTLFPQPTCRRSLQGWGAARSSWGGEC
jgi:DNA-binding winged helix-turn-helix (wHTH) protein